jgi:hypothetical protein
MIASMLRSCSLALALLLLASCSDSELVGVHIALRKDGSGTLTARALQASSIAGPAEPTLKGIDWQARASLVSSQGSFQNLGSVELGEREVRFAPSNEDQPRLRVFLARNKDLAWVKALTPDETTRKSLAKVHDPNSKQKEIADTIRFEIRLPDQVISSGIAPTGRGIEAAHEQNRAYLVLPVATMLTEGDDLIWDISWK